jgi:Ca-activated chloride channel homolog
MKRLPIRSALAALVALGAAGCGFAPMSTVGSGGATVGGVKDLELARTKVAAGQVPAPEDFPPEGIYAEHDLPVDGPPCGQTFCVRAGSAIAPGLDGDQNVAWVQLGLSTNLNPATLQRPPLEVALIIDVSCSMAGEGMTMAKEAANRAIDNLGENDLLSVVEFDSSAAVLVRPTPVTDKEALKAVIARLEHKGGTCIECGLRVGYAQLEAAPSGKSRRAILITDAQPNVGATGEGEFTELLEAKAEAGIGTSVVGVSLDFGQALVRRISAVRGANAHFLSSVDDATRLFGEDFKFWVTPVAYDLDLSFTPKAPLSVAAFHGVPGEDAAAATTHVSTVFLSRERGALVVRLDQAAEPSAELGALALSYQSPDGTPHQQALDVFAPAEAAPAWGAASTRKALALTRFVLGARDACALAQKGDRGAAAVKADAVATALAAEAAATQDAGLKAEAEFARALADLLAPQ